MSKTLIFKLFLVGLVILVSTWLYLSFPLSSKVNESQVDSISSEVKSVIDEKTGLPAAGTYKLHKIFPVPERQILNSSGESKDLHEFTYGKYTLLTFFYQHCSDAGGCPYAMTVFNSVKSTLEKDASLAQSVRMVSISFDPYRDTPMMMAGLEKQMNRNDKKDSVKWSFLTTANTDALLPLVDGFGQNVDIVIDPVTGSQTMTYQHVLKIFLIDKVGFVREIYSTAYLSPEMLLNDIKTLVMEDSQTSVIEDSH